jgi:(R,R)-butanediol dehydrogenase / meso-butanediol dehydrogenase / diacetyl reductase
MRALSYVAAGNVEVSEIDATPPAEGQVQIEVAYTGICGTDLHIFHGSMDARVVRPAVIGHEMAGRIAALGVGVDGWAVGDPVTVVPLDWDGTCPACLAGNTHLCHNLKFIGIDAPGSLQRLWTVPARTLVRLPDTLPLDHGALVEPTAVAVHDVRRAHLVAGEKTLVVGGGPVGLLIAIVARNAGADVLVIEPNAYRRELAVLLGLQAVDPGAVDVTAAVTGWSAGAGAAVAFEVSGAAAGVTAAVDALAVRGRLVLVAIHGTPREVNLHRFFWRELSLIGARLYHRADFERAVELVAAGVIPTAQLISAVVPLSAGAAAFELLEGGAVMKVLIDGQA